ncbi:polynucleotide kinase [Gordonia phage Rabbitrun]|uniref:Polynucleotide kinase n=1 Tax=Gordonia phage Rabbitrun TaxID=2762280 RepID=A0A7G8LIQ1_9CAUD|nr:polynucleotide kinase [Gordonia phage Rabbitrun]QNJ57123.1 polynucleotide kinase [Gordonia phage Rabbitrun]
MAAELVAMRGLPASGKTTRARQIAKETGAVVVGRDFERFQMFGEWWTGKPEHEDAVTVALNAKVRALLKANQSVVVDNTHIQVRYLKDWAKVASECGATFRIEDVKTPQDVCEERDFWREGAGERFVGPEVIARMAKQINWGIPKPVAPIVVEPVDHKVAEELMLPGAIIVDIDGTLAHMTGRSPYDYSRVGEDRVDPTIARMVREYEQLGYDIIACSGRDDECRTMTVAWLLANDIPFHKLLMRPTDAKDANGNKLPDWIVKYNLFNENVRGKYDVEFVLDDRNQVVDMWRKLGLKCLQVAPGDF